MVKGLGFVGLFGLLTCWSVSALLKKGRLGFMSLLKRIFPFTAKQSVNILSEFGPLVTMFVLNAAYDINTGTWALIITTVFAIGAMLYMFGRPPIFPLIASTVTIIFGALTIITGDPMWVQIKVTIFNLMFAIFLFGGLWFNRNFFRYVFESTFHYSKEGWDKFTKSFAWFFVFTAVANEIVRLSFVDTEVYNILGYEMNGVNVWILFKIALIMPASGVYAWLLTRIMQKYRLQDGGKTAIADDAASDVISTDATLPSAKTDHTDKVMRTAVVPARS